MGHPGKRSLTGTRHRAARNARTRGPGTAHRRARWLPTTMARSCRRGRTRPAPTAGSAPARRLGPRPWRNRRTPVRWPSGRRCGLHVPERLLANRVDVGNAVVDVGERASVEEVRSVHRVPSLPKQLRERDHSVGHPTHMVKEHDLSHPPTLQEAHPHDSRKRLLGRWPVCGRRWPRPAGSAMLPSCRERIRPRGS